jgi:hemolysin III
MIDAIGANAVLVLIASGMCFIAGGVVYGTERPDPFPNIFGFHEIFHLLVTVGFLLQIGVVLKHIVAV